MKNCPGTCNKCKETTPQNVCGATPSWAPCPANVLWSCVIPLRGGMFERKTRGHTEDLVGGRVVKNRMT
jgi:hypothetical protein